MYLLGGNIGMESPGDPFNALEGISSTPSNSVLMGTTGSTPISTSTSSVTTSIGHTQPTYIEPYNEQMDVAVTTLSIPASSSVPTSTTNTPTQTIIGNLQGVLGMGSGSNVSETSSSGGISSKKESFLDKWKKLPDWKKGLIVLAIATSSYYGYKQLKN